MSSVNIAHLFTHSLTHKRKSRVSDGKGGWSTAYTEQGGISGRVVPATARDLSLGSQLQARVTHAIYIAPGSDVEVGDRFVFDGKNYDVTIPDEGQPSIPIYRKVLVERIQKPS